MHILNALFALVKNRKAGYNKIEQTKTIYSTLVENFNNIDNILHFSLLFYLYNLSNIIIFVFLTFAYLSIYFMLLAGKSYYFILIFYIFGFAIII